MIGIYSAFLGLFIPSAGGKWLIEAPYMLDAAKSLQVHLGWVVQTYNATEALANLIHPFWMLPLVGILGLKARDIVGYSMLQFVVHVPLVLFLVWALNYTLTYVPPVLPCMKRPELMRETCSPIAYRTPTPRQMLALDGGGIRGVLTLSILKAIETQLGVARLSDYFDYIAGTSTGAIIATGLAIGQDRGRADRLLPLHRYRHVREDQVPRTAEQPLSQRPAGAAAQIRVRRHD